jgi:serine/threonine-protein kinase RsbW
VVILAKKLVIPSDLESARGLEETLLGAVEDRGYGPASRFAIKLALEEALNNAIKHGNGCDPRKSVEVSFDVTGRRTIITITDQGRGFDPASVPDPTADENLEKPCGRGIMLMRAYMDEVRYNKVGNQVTMVKRNS